MWSRVVEVMLACWLAISPFFFDTAGDESHPWIKTYVCAAAVMILSLASMARRFDKAHLGILLVSAWLAVPALRGIGTALPSPVVQNHFLIALLLTMLAVLPSRSLEPPRSWLEHHARAGHEADPYRLPRARTVTTTGEQGE